MTELQQQTDKEPKKDRKTWLLWAIIALLLLALLYQATRPDQEVTGPKLGKPGTEYFNQEPQKQGIENSGRIGVSIPASLTVQDGKAMIRIKNTGQQAYVPYTLAEGREIYRSSRIIEPGDEVNAIIQVGNADKCVTYVETLDGGKFSVTSKLTR
ncbi:MAG TPA: hypothetical protein DDZ91_12000 [Firmicutes bacterium]|nr:hypothetical protein [Bacillota bacterium]